MSSTDTTGDQLAGDGIAGDHAAVKATYRRYLQRCNEHRFDELGEFVAENVQGGGQPQGLGSYGDGLRAVVEEIPDFHWELQHVLVDGCWMSAHLVDTGTRADGRAFAFEEFSLYRLADGRIAEVWGNLDVTRLRAR